MPARPFRRLLIPAELFDAILGQARAESPLECCGFLAGQVEREEGIVAARYPLANAAASPVEHVSDARQTFDATRDIERRGLGVLAVYHSHPTTHPVPSRTDLQRNYSTEVVSLIVSLEHEPPAVRAWWLTDKGYEEAAFVVSGPPASGERPG